MDPTTAMNEERIKRILVALDSSEANKSLLQAATQLAASLDAQLQALFVEDINLLRMAQLPIAREVTATSRTARQLNLADMERQLHSQVERLRRIVEATALQFNLPVEFKVLRGQITAELCTAVQEVDLLIVGKNTQLQRYSEKLGSITRDMLLSAKCNLLLLRHGAILEKPVALFYSDGEASQRALQLAMVLARGDAGQLTVFYPSAENKQIQTWQEQVNAIAKAFAIVPTHYMLHENTTAAVLKALAEHKARVLILNPEQSVFDQTQTEQLIIQCQTPVLLVR